MNLDFNKGNGLIPVIIQHTQSLQVLMLGYMNEEALKVTLETGKVTFFSRSKNRLWTKGESSKNYLLLNDLSIDCDLDTLLMKATPTGPTCHLGTTSCFKEETSKGFLYELEKTIHERIDQETEGSYTSQLYKKGINKVAQKVGEEAVELVIESKDDRLDLFQNEAADLLYHFLILLKAKKTSLEDIENVLKNRKQ